METMTRQEALAAGLKRYFTGKPCPQGHVVEHKVSGACIECARLDKQRWRKANPERVKALKLAEQKRNRAKANERNRRYSSQDRVKAMKSQWQKEHPEIGAAKSMAYNAAKLRQMPAWADVAAIETVYQKAAEMRKTGLDVHVDHVIPLRGKTVRGLHVHYNLEIIEAKRNRSKSNHF